MKFPALPPGSPAQLRFIAALPPLLPLPIDPATRAIRVLSSRVVDSHLVDVVLSLHFGTALDSTIDDAMSCEGIAEGLLHKLVADYTFRSVEVSHLVYSQAPAPTRAVLAHDWSHRVGEPGYKGIYARECWNEASDQEFLDNFTGWLEKEGVPVTPPEPEPPAYLY